MVLLSIPAAGRDMEGCDRGGSKLTIVNEPDICRIQGPVELRMAAGGVRACATSIRFAATATGAVRMCIGAVGVGGSCVAQWCMFEQ